MKKLEINVYTEDPTPMYVEAISKAKTAEELVKAIEPFSEVCDDAYALAKTLFDEDVVQMHKDWKKAGSGKLSEDWIRAFNSCFGVIIMPKKLMETAIIASRYHCPWGATYLRIEEMKAKRNTKKKPCKSTQ